MKERIETPIWYGMAPFVILSHFYAISVNNGEYINAVCDRNEAENITRVLYPNDNVS